MNEENKILITFGKAENPTSREISLIKQLSFQEIKQACESYNPDVDYLEVLANLLYLKNFVRRQEANENGLS